jgi:hypothetical protein
MICGGVRHAVGLALRTRPRRARRTLVAEIWNFVANALRLEAPRPERTRKSSKVKS